MVFGSFGGDGCLIVRGFDCCGFFCSGDDWMVGVAFRSGWMVVDRDGGFVGVRCGLVGRSDVRIGFKVCGFDGGFIRDVRSGFKVRSFDDGYVRIVGFEVRSVGHFGRRIWRGVVNGSMRCSVRFGDSFSGSVCGSFIGNGRFGGCSVSFFKNGNWRFGIVVLWLMFVVVVVALVGVVSGCDYIHISFHGVGFVGGGLCLLLDVRGCFVSIGLVMDVRSGFGVSDVRGFCSVRSQGMFLVRGMLLVGVVRSGFDGGGFCDGGVMVKNRGEWGSRSSTIDRVVG
jgi:hypothetical protein